MHYKTLFLHNGYMKSLEIYKNYITLFCLEKNKLFDKIILTQKSEPCMTYYPKWLLTIKYKYQLRNNTILSRALFRNAQ